jgi:hypothetical protein
MERTPELQALANSMAFECYGMKLDEALAHGICLDCKEPATPNCYSADGVAEYNISGLCELCFDRLTQAEDEEDA